MMENGKPRKRRQLSPEEKWEVFLEVCSRGQPRTGLPPSRGNGLDTHRFAEAADAPSAPRPTTQAINPAATPPATPTAPCSAPSKMRNPRI